MKLYSEVPIKPISRKINHQSKILSLGSCFATEMGQKLQEYEFQTLINPFGTQFHPLAIEHTFNRIYAREPYIESEIYHHGGLFFSWDHSAKFSKSKKEQVLEAINTNIDEANTFLGETTHVIITLGTAWAYYLSQGEFFVSNCHKISQKYFEKILLSQEQVYESLRNMILKIYDVRPEAEIIFTISPVRHLRDGFRENQVSKGVLQYAIHQVLNDFEEINYFPSYEIALDELRDYRFYAEDLAHLNDVGINYIWDKFSANYCTEHTLKLNAEIEKIKKALSHKPFNADSITYKKFLYDTQKKAEAMQTQLHAEALKSTLEALKQKLC
ncbi:MAG: GSCFA domain-containing protein [Weeksellaceae bacterium]